MCNISNVLKQLTIEQLIQVKEGVKNSRIDKNYIDYEIFRMRFA